MKDSHSLLKVYFVLLPNKGNYLVLLLTVTQNNYLVFVWGLSFLSENYKRTTVKTKTKNAGWMLRRALAKLFQGFRPKPFLCLEHNLLALLTHIVLKVMVSNVFKLTINCRKVATKTLEEIIMAIWLLKKNHRNSC